MLTQPEIHRLVNNYIGVSRFGYLQGFSSNKELEEFYLSDCDIEINIYDDFDSGTTIKNKFIAILEKSKPSIQSKILKGVLKKYRVSDFPSEERERKQELYDEFQEIIKRLNKAAPEETEIAQSAEDLFKRQFPAGLPFGLKKPHFAFVPEQGSQKWYFEDEHQIGVIRENVYPNFTYQKLKDCLRKTLIGSSDLRGTLIGMIQTECEIKFFESYANQYKMWTQEVPVLIPQAWIQWHSRNKEDLRLRKSSCADDPHRVDFVAFWRQKRFTILIDDISHYAKEVGSPRQKRWDANEQAYSKTLQQYRKLCKEGWQVFRVSNWEIRNEELITEILTDLREYMDF